MYYAFELINGNYELVAQSRSIDILRENYPEAEIIGW